MRTLRLQQTDPAGGGEVLSELGTDQIGHVHCVVDSPGDVVAQQRLVVGDAVPQAIQAPDRPTNIAAVGAGAKAWCSAGTHSAFPWAEELRKRQNPNLNSAITLQGAAAGPPAESIARCRDLRLLTLTSTRRPTPEARATAALLEARRHGLTGIDRDPPPIAVAAGRPEGPVRGEPAEGAHGRRGKGSWYTSADVGADWESDG